MAAVELRLGIEGIEVGHPSSEVEEDNALRFGSMLGRTPGEEFADETREDEATAEEGAEDGAAVDHYSFSMRFSRFSTALNPNLKYIAAEKNNTINEKLKIILSNT